MKSRHAGLVASAALVGIVAVSVSAPSANAGVAGETYVSYSTYGTQAGASITISLDASAFAAQGWSVESDEYVFPVLVGKDNAITLMTLDGEFLSMGGSPRVLGTIAMLGADDNGVKVANFELPFAGRANVAFTDGNHPVFEISGESLVVNITGSTLEISGTISMHAAASEVGLDAEVGQIGEFTLTTRIDVSDVDNTVQPETVAVPGDGPQELPGADVIVGSLPNIRNWTNGNAIGGLLAYSVATTSCNIGTQPLDWFVGPNPRHPVIGQNLYRLMDGRIEQIGQSWLKHGFCALQQPLCQGCSPVCGGCCSQLGVGCSDPYSSSRNGTFSNMGPKREINPAEGTNLGNHAFASGNATLRGRIQVRKDDLDPAQNAGALYYVEGHYIAQDDAQFGDRTNDDNNASYRRVSVTLPQYNLNSAGGTIREKGAIHAWKAVDPQVQMVEIDVPDDGRFTLACRVTDNGDGTWHYEYAMHNLNSNRAAQSFSVPLASGVTTSNVGFHDVDYHSGDPYSLTDWAATEGGNSLTWSTQTFAQNVNANALRWGTMYNFRFDADSEPELGEISVGLFRTGTPAAVSAAAFVPSSVGPAIIHGAADTSFADHSFGGYIDPKAESDDGVNVNLGLDTVTIVFSESVFAIGGGAVTPASFMVTQTGAGAAPTVTAVDSSANPAISLTLSGAITLQEWTTIRANVENASGQAIANLGNQGSGVNEPDRIDIGYLPADVDQNSQITPFDLLAFRQIINGVVEPAAGIDLDVIDTDRSGDSSPFDLLALRQLINGVNPPATQSWTGASMNNVRP